MLYLSHGLPIPVTEVGEEDNVKERGEDELVDEGLSGHLLRYRE